MGFSKHKGNCARETRKHPAAVEVMYKREPAGFGDALSITPRIDEWRRFQARINLVRPGFVFM